MRPSATIADGRARSIARLPKRIAPRQGRTTPEIARLSVDFPAPLEPSTATISLSFTPRSMPRRISVAPYPAWRPLMASSSAMAAHPSRSAMAEIGFDHPRVRGDLAGRSHRDHAAFGKHVDLARQAHHRLHHVLDHHDG